VRILLVTLVATVAATTATAGTRTAEPPCAGRALSASFAVVPGSAGAGNIVYAIRLRNRSSENCFVSGLAGMQLLGRYGHALPTKAVAGFPGALTAVRVVLRPGGYASASARFSPDVPGPGEGHPGKPCEPKAYRVRVHAPPGSGWTTGAVTPPTSVCEHGHMSLSALVAGTKPPHT
jgi:hypothetical protein